MYARVLVAKPEERGHMGDIKRYTSQDNTKWKHRNASNGLMRIL
jgi:hypothetical protein